MSATIELFPTRVPTRARIPIRGAEVAGRYAGRAQEAFELLALATTDQERQTLCDIAELWLDMAEAALPPRR
jgi:hypothetical protein